MNLTLDLRVVSVETFEIQNTHCMYLKQGFLYTAIAVRVVIMDVGQGVNVDAGAQVAEGASGEQGQGVQLPRWNSW